MSTQRTRPAWEGSTRRERLPANWNTELRPEALHRNPQQICHWCGFAGGTSLDHIVAGDDHRQENLDWIHDWRDVGRWLGADGLPSNRNCHAEKTGREAHAARRRPPAEVHAALR